jgi:hypothetical protein
LSLDALDRGNKERARAAGWIEETGCWVSPITPAIDRVLREPIRGVVLTEVVSEFTGQQPVIEALQQVLGEIRPERGGRWLKVLKATHEVAKCVTEIV